MKAPFVYFGGKATIAHLVWAALGQPKHYIEPFAGSCAVLLARPHYQPGMIESVNDKDGFIANVWRALQHNPDEVAKWCDWPVNHADLCARRATLIKNEARLLENLIANDEWCDAKMAGYWIWAASCWIGSGLTRPGQGPHLGDGGMGVHATGQIPHLTNAGMGVHATGQIPHLGTGGKGVQEPYNTNIYKTFRELSERLRYVRVVCGDWMRVCGGNWQDKLGSCGMFFDPPYGDTDRDTEIYHHDSTDISAEVEKWVLERGKIPSYRIVAAGYDSEYKSLVENGWTTQAWKTNGGYANTAPDNNQTRGKDNRQREVLFFSPHCHKTDLF